MDKLEKLYNTLTKYKMYTKSFDEFKTQFSNSSKVKKLYEYVNSKGLYTKSEEEFKQQFFSTLLKEPEPLKKKEDSVSQSDSVAGNSLLDYKAPKNSWESKVLDYHKKNPTNVPQVQTNANGKIIQLSPNKRVYYDVKSGNKTYIDNDIERLPGQSKSETTYTDAKLKVAENLEYEDLLNSSTLKDKLNFESSTLQAYVAQNNIPINTPEDWIKAGELLASEKINKIANQKTTDEIKAERQFELNKNLSANQLFGNTTTSIENKRNRLDVARLNPIYQSIERKFPEKLKGIDLNDFNDYLYQSGLLNDFNKLSSLNQTGHYDEEREVVDLMNGFVSWKSVSSIKDMAINQARLMNNNFQDEETKKATVLNYNKVANDFRSTSNYIKDNVIPKFDKYVKEEKERQSKHESYAKEKVGTKIQVTLENTVNKLNNTLLNITDSAIRLVGDGANILTSRNYDKAINSFTDNFVDILINGSKNLSFNTVDQNVVDNSKTYIVDGKSYTQKSDGYVYDKNNNIVNDIDLSKSSSVTDNKEFNPIGIVSEGINQLGLVSLSAGTGTLAPYFLVGYEQNRQSYLDAFPDANIMEATAYATSMSSIELLSEKILPSSKYFEMGAGKAILNAVKGIGKESRSKAIEFATKNYLTTVLKENATEVIPMVAQFGIDNAINSVKNEKGFKAEWSNDELASTLAVTTVFSGLLGLRNANYDLKSLRSGMSFNDALVLSTRNPEVRKEINNMLNDKTVQDYLGTDVIQEFKDKTLEFEKYKDKLPENSTYEQFEKVKVLLDEKAQLIEKRKNLDENFREPVDKRIEELNRQIKEVYTEKESVELQEENIDNSTTETKNAKQVYENVVVERKQLREEKTKLVDEKEFLEVQEQTEETTNRITEIDKQITELDTKIADNKVKGKEAYAETQKSFSETPIFVSENKESSSNEKVEFTKQQRSNQTSLIIKDVNKGKTSLEEEITDAYSTLSSIEKKHGKDSEQYKTQEKVINELNDYKNKVDFSNGEFDLRIENENPIVTNKKGKLVNENTKRKIIKEAIQNGVFDNLERVLDRERLQLQNENQVIDYVIQNSKNPIEIAETIVQQKEIDEANNTRSDLESKIAEKVRNKSVKKSSFIQFADRNNIDKRIEGSYLSNNGKGLDKIAMEVETELYGDYNPSQPRVTEQDIVDFILRNPSSRDYWAKNESSEIQSLKENFKKYSGIPATQSNLDLFLNKNQDQSTEYHQEENEISKSKIVTELESIFAEEFDDVLPFQKNNKSSRKISKKAFDKLVEKLQKAFPFLKNNSTFDFNQFEKWVKEEGLNLEDISYLFGNENNTDLSKDNYKQLSEAKKLQREGISNSEIRKATGWFVGLDKQWKYIIEDSEMEFKLDVLKLNPTRTIQYNKNIPLTNFIKYKELFKNYPKLANTKVTFYANRADDAYGRSYQSTNGERVIAINVGKIRRDRGITTSELRSEQKQSLQEAILHEIQHNIQGISSRQAVLETGVVLKNRGTNPSVILNKLRNNELNIYRVNGGKLNYSEFSKDKLESLSNLLYESQSNEIEARATSDNNLQREVNSLQQPVFWIEDTSNTIQLNSSVGLDLMQTLDGSVYGAVLPSGRMYFDENNLNANTPIHEYGHLWTNLIKHQNSEVYSKVIEIVKRDKQAMDEVKRDSLYSHLTTDQQIAEEVLARHIGNIGEQNYWNKKEASLVEKIKNAIHDLFEYVKGLFGKSEPNVLQWTNEQFEKVTLIELASGISNDLLKGNQIFTENNTKFVNDEHLEKSPSNGIQFSTQNNNQQHSAGSKVNLNPTNTNIQIPTKLPERLHKKVVNIMRDSIDKYPTTKQILDKGLNYLKKQEWYQNLNQQEKNYLEFNLIKHLKQGYEPIPKQKTRTEIKAEVFHELAKGKSDEVIISKYKNRRDQRIARDIIERNNTKFKTDEEIFNHVNDIMDRAKKAQKAKINASVFFKRMISNFRKNFVDNQGDSGKLLKDGGLKIVRNYIHAQRGATGYASEYYHSKTKEIYKGLNDTDVDNLNKIIMNRRIIQIDKSRAKEGLEEIKHMMDLNQNKCEIHLKGLKNELGEQQFNKLNDRADKFFDAHRELLDMLEKADVISKELKEQLIDLDYARREYTDFMKDEEGNYLEKNSFQTKKSEEAIKSLTGGRDGLLVTDSEYLFSRTTQITMNAIARNNTMISLQKEMKIQKEYVENLKTKNLKDLTRKEKQTIKYFTELEKQVVYNKKEAGRGFVEIKYRDKGEKKSVFMKQEFADSFRATYVTKGKVLPILNISSKIIKMIATGNNPSFFITNTPRDIFMVATLSNEYGNNLGANLINVTYNAGKHATKMVIERGAKLIGKEYYHETMQKYIEYGGSMEMLNTQGDIRKTKVVDFIKDSFGRRTQNVASTVVGFLKLQVVQDASEMGVRLAVFDKGVKNRFKKEGVKNEAEFRQKYAHETAYEINSRLRDIYTSAVVSARDTSDFAQKGNYYTLMESFIPYFNASMQAKRFMIDSIKEDPLGTTFKITQGAVGISSMIIGGGMLALKATLDDDDEDKKLSTAELYLKFYSGVSDYDKLNYFVFPIRKNNNGEFLYLRGAKAQDLIPFFALTEGLMISSLKMYAGDKSETDIYGNVIKAISKNWSPFEIETDKEGLIDNIIGTGTANLTKNPAIKATVTYQSGYDYFRDQPLSYKQGKINPKLEGYESNKVEDFYKEIGRKYNVSPARLKGFVESLITSPTTNSFVGLLYGGADWALANEKSKDKKLLKDYVSKSFTGRLLKETSDFNRSRKKNKLVDEMRLSNQRDDLERKTRVKELALAIFDKKLTKTEAIEEINTFDTTEEDKDRRINQLNERLKNKNVPQSVFDIKYETVKKNKAIMLMIEFDNDYFNQKKLSAEQRKLKEYLEENKAIDNETKRIYEKMIK